MPAMWKSYLKYFITLAIMNVLKVFWLFPMKKTDVLFMSFNGKQYSDSPKSMSKVIRERYPEKRVIWALSDPALISEYDRAEIDRIVRVDSLRYYYTFCVAGTIIVNNSIPSFMPVRRRQIVVQTWHGGGMLKKHGYAEETPDPYTNLYFRIQNKKYSVFLSSSRVVTEGLIQASFHYESEILKIGLPRNDILFLSHTEMRDKVCRYFGLEDGADKGIILYAPTFRGHTTDARFLPEQDMLDIEECIKLFNKRFWKEFVFLFRAHHAMHDIRMKGNYISATEYPDMQELLCAADILITDYSSCGHDFALTRKPVFSYIPDVENYARENGFLNDVRELPFPYALNMKEMSQKILSFDETGYIQAVESYLERLGNYDTGNASMKLCSWLERQWKELP